MNRPRQAVDPAKPKSESARTRRVFAGASAAGSSTAASGRPTPHADGMADPGRRMPLVPALEVLQAYRTNEVVVTAMGAAREWFELGTHPLDFVFVPSSMGQASSLGLGLALAQPERRVIVCNGDGSTLMNLGSLVTITALAPANFTLIVFDNGVYEVTGAQQTPGCAQWRRDGRDVDYCGIARACRFRSVYQFDDLDAWKAGLPSILQAKGPIFVLARVEPMPSRSAPRFPGPPQERVAEFMAALQAQPDGQRPASESRSS